MATQELLDFPERVEAMMCQESTAYRCDDYLSPEWLHRREREAAAEGAGRGDNPQGSVSSSSSGVINEMWREKICEWSYQVVDHFDFNREVVSISMSYLDRYLATRTVNKKIFQLAAMTSLYLAIKLYEPGNLRMSSLIDLSRGYFLVDHIVSMEDCILQALEWRVHPPTPFSFTREFLMILPPEVSPEIRHDINELARFLTELSVCDYYFVTKKPSSVALAAMLNAIELQGSLRQHPRIQGEFLAYLFNVGVNANDPEVVACYERLREMYVSGGYAPDLLVQDPEPCERIATVSPVSVMQSPDFSENNSSVC